ncbi:DNA-directed RNA polymerase subunit K [Candidatus Pacearchaeota archaeon]|nr:DNA-directed RNA polymerase subunit K [Candidatus Pacearchaeota archaeon]
MEQQVFSKYEMARIIGARALQITMDAPLLLKISEEKLKELRYDALKIAELEVQEGVLPIAINRPTPKKRKEKLSAVKEEKVSDEEIVAKEQEVEKEIVQDASELGFAEHDEDSAELESSSGNGAEEQ